MLEAFKKHLDEHLPDLKEKSLLVACSGGLDSVVLVHLCEACQLDYAIAHCNFGLRGAESDADERFVAELSHTLQRPFFVTHFDTLGYVNKHQVSVQMAARALRYHWFSEILGQQDLEVLLTAHHADDSLETFIINLSRGSGLEGLTGIPERGKALARPLLPFSRDEIQQYAKVCKLAWRDDSGNEESKYLRNKIRMEVVPRLRELHPAFLENFLRAQNHLAGSALILQQHREQLTEQIFDQEGGHVRMAVAALEALIPREDYLHLLFSAYGFEGGQVAGLLASGSGRFLRSKTHRLIRDREHLLLQPWPLEEAGACEFALGTGSVLSPIRLTMEEVMQMGERSRHILYVDKETLNPVLRLRKWQKGDYFYPLGMDGKKKISKLYKDEKLDMIAKEGQWLLCSGDDIVWVVGLRADERFKVTDTTNTILKITWKA